MADFNKLRLVAEEAIDRLSEELFELNQEIWRNPELCFEERQAHQLLTKYLEEKGFKVSRHYTLETAFRAESGENGTGPTVGVMCEYDALPDIGHACGHNLIAEAAVAASIAIKAALDSEEAKLGRVVILGTPAEEGGGGKVKMIDNGCFDDLDFCAMVHPVPNGSDMSFPPFLACSSLTVTYTGHAAHAAAFPWEGVNALDAAVSAYNNISMLRQQLKPTWRVHTIIKNGGVKTNIIPEKSVVECSVRAPTKDEMEALRVKVIACFEAAAQATGCTSEVELCEPCEVYLDVRTNDKLGRLYHSHAEAMGVKFISKEEQQNKSTGSTDMGNVSYIKPSIHPLYSIDTTAVNHTHGFTAATGVKVAHEKTLIAAKAMAFTAIEVMCNPEIMKEVQVDFAKISK